MTNRRSFIRDTFLGIAATLVPKILQPVVPQVVNKVSWEQLIPIVDEYQLTTLKMQQTVAKSFSPLWWEGAAYKQLDQRRSELIGEMHEFFNNK